jgi:hypothetical protein
VDNKLEANNGALSLSDNALIRTPIESR